MDPEIGPAIVKGEGQESQQLVAFGSGGQQGLAVLLNRWQHNVADGLPEDGAPRYGGGEPSSPPRAGERERYAR